MPIKHITSNLGTIFGNTSWEDRDPKLDHTRTEVISPEKSLPIDYETFEYFIQEWQKTEKALDKEYSGTFGNDMIYFISEIVNPPFYILRDIIFNKYDDETISNFVHKGQIQYWPDDYFEKKYGKAENGWIIQEDDYKDAITIDTIKGLYEYIYKN